MVMQTEWKMGSGLKLYGTYLTTEFHKQKIAHDGGCSGGASVGYSVNENEKRS